MSTSRAIHRALATVAAASLLTACQFIPSRGISRERAIELALQGGTPIERPVVTGTREGTLRDLRIGALGQPGPGQDMGQLVWEVSLQGNQTVCPPAPGGACQVVPATTRVYLDHATGAFIFSETGGS